MTRFAERRQARQENRQDRRNKRHGGSSVSSSCSSKGSKGSCKSHSSHKSSCNSSYSSSCSSKGSHTSHGSSGGGGNTYVMREKLLTFGKDFEIKEASHVVEVVPERPSSMWITKYFVFVRLSTSASQSMVRYSIRFRSVKCVYVIL